MDFPPDHGDPEADFQGGSKRPTSTVVLATILGLVAILVVWFLVVGGFLIGPSKEPPAGPVPSSVEARPADPDKCRSLALEAWTRFIESPDLESRAREVADPDRVKPLMRDFYEDRQHPYPTMAKISKGVVASEGARDAVIFSVEPFQGPNYAVALVWHEGRYRIDWEALIAYGTTDWYALVEGKPDKTHLMRVFLTPLKERWDHPALPEEARSYLMEHRDFPDSAIAIVLPDQVNAYIATFDQPRMPARVRVRWAEEYGAFQLQGAPTPNWSD